MRARRGASRRTDFVAGPASWVDEAGCVAAVFRAVFGVDFLADLVCLDENNVFRLLVQMQEFGVVSNASRSKEGTRGDLDG